MAKVWKTAKKRFSSICIVDRFLILFMLILFFYMCCRLFAGTDTSDTANTIGIIVRTSAAAIFGYFISNNFNKSTISMKTTSTDYTETTLSAKPTSLNTEQAFQNQIGFTAASTAEKQELGKISFTENTVPNSGHCSKIQVYVVSLVGLFSLCILLVATHYQNGTSEFTAIISQLRDFVSTCIGFLIGCGKNTSD